MDISQGSSKKLEKIQYAPNEVKRNINIRLTTLPSITEPYDPVVGSEETKEEASYSLSYLVCSSVPAWVGEDVGYDFITCMSSKYCKEQTTHLSVSSPPSTSEVGCDTRNNATGYANLCPEHDLTSLLVTLDIS